MATEAQRVTPLSTLREGTGSCRDALRHSGAVNTDDPGGQYATTRPPDRRRHQRSDGQTGRMNRADVSEGADSHDFQKWSRMSSAARNGGLQ